MLNKAILVGRLTADPELRQTPSGVFVTSFTVAVNRAYPKEKGEQQADFIDIVAWRSTAEFACKYFKKGSAIGIDGSIQTRSYTDKEGNKRKAVEVLASNVSFVESKNRQLDAGIQEFPQAPQTEFTELSIEDDDGDLPF